MGAREVWNRRIRSRSRTSVSLGGASPTGHISNVGLMLATSFNSLSFSLDSMFVREKEYTYCQALEAVCNPLGVPDTRDGFCPSDLANYVQQIFGIDPDTHKRCLRAVQTSKASNVCLCLTVEEARDLKPFNSNAICDPYCVVQVKSQNRNVTPKSSPQVSPKSQRRGTSPTQASRRHSSLRPDHQGHRETHTLKGTSKPHWNAEFEIPVCDVQNEELCVYIWDDSLNNTDTDFIQKPLVTKNKHSFKNLFRHFHKSGDKMDGCIGQFKISLRDIPVLGTDQWYDLYEDSKNRKRTSGQCHLKLQLTARPSADSAESDQCSSEDFFSVVQRVYRHAMDLLLSDTGQEVDRPLLKELPTKSRMVLDQFAAQNHFTVLSQKIIELSALLELYCDIQCPCDVSASLIRRTIDEADSLWTNKQKQNRCHEIHGIVTLRELFSKTEVALLEQMTSQYLDQTTEKLSRDSSFPKTFPPIGISIEELKRALGFSKQLLSLMHKISNNNTRNRLTEVLKDQIQSDCQALWSLKLQFIKSVDKDAVISEAKIFTGIVRECIDHCSPAMEVSQYFIEFNINYEKTVIVFLEKKITAKAKEVMLRIDSYQKKFLRYRSNIMDSSVVSQNLFSALRNFVGIAKSHFTMRDLYRITMTTYQDWFKQAVTYWLQTFREEGIRRVVKALDIDKDVVQVTEGVKISNSAVDVVSNLHRICTEWKAVDYNDADVSLLAATKITELICDGITRYLEKIEDILENNGYFDFIDNCQFDVTDQLCITLNNIVHVIHYLNKLPELLEWDKVCQNMSIKYEDESVGRRCEATLQRLIRTTQEELISRAKALWNKVMDIMKMDLDGYTQKFAQCQPNKLSSVDPLLDYLKTNLAVFHKKLDHFIVPYVVEGLWNKTISTFAANLMSGQHQNYYETMHNHLESLYAYFADVGLSSDVRDCENFCQLVNAITLHYTDTSDLMLEYYKSLTSPAASPAVYYGHLEVKVGYQVDPNATVNSSIKAVRFVDETDSVDKNGNTQPEQIVNVYVNVSRAKKLPGMLEKGETSNTFVSLALCPTTLFPINIDLKTPTIKGTVNPVYDVTVRYQGIPLSQLKRDGATLLLTTWHTDTFLPCHHFLGEAAIPLNIIPSLDPLQCIEDIPASICPLVRPEQPTSGPFKVLQERQSWDEVAKDMVTRRKRDTGLTTAWPLCRPMSYLVSMLRGGQSSKVMGQPKISAPVL